CAVVTESDWLEQCFEIDGHRLVACGDDVLVVEVAGCEAVQQRQQSACASEVRGASPFVSAPGVLDELGPPVAVACDCLRRSKSYRALAVELFDESCPGYVDAKVPWLVDHSTPIVE